MDESKKEIGWGILGTGKVVGKLGPALRAARGARLVAIASRDAARAQAAVALYGARHAHAGYESLLADPEIDVVLNALHNGLHCEWTVRALEAGKHVLCEKPMGLSAVEVERMFAAARASQRYLMEGFMYRFHPQLAAAQRLVAEGQLGRLVHLRANYLSGGPDRQNPRFRADAGGGALLDLGCYCVNLSRLFAQCEPERVTAHSHYDRETGVDLTTNGMLHFPGGLTAHLACSFESVGFYAVEIIGQEGRLHIPHPWRPPQWPAEIALTRKDATEIYRIEPAGVSPDPILPFILEIEHFSDSVRHQRAPRFPGGFDPEIDALANARVLDALAASARQRRTVGLINECASQERASRPLAAE